MGTAPRPKVASSLQQAPPKPKSETEPVSLFIHYTDFYAFAPIFMHKLLSWPRAGVRGQGWPWLCIGGIFMHLHPFLCKRCITRKWVQMQENGCKAAKMGTKFLPIFFEKSA